MTARRKVGREAFRSQRLEWAFKCLRGPWPGLRITVQFLTSVSLPAHSMSEIMYGACHRIETAKMWQAAAIRFRLAKRRRAIVALPHSRHPLTATGHRSGSRHDRGISMLQRNAKHIWARAHVCCWPGGTHAPHLLQVCAALFARAKATLVMFAQSNIGAHVVTCRLRPVAQHVKQGHGRAKERRSQLCRAAPCKCAPSTP